MIEKSIPEETLDGLRTKSSVIQELAEVTKMAIYDNNSLERAIEQILPSTKKAKIEELRKAYDKALADGDISRMMGIETAMDILGIEF